MRWPPAIRQAEAAKSPTGGRLGRLVELSPTEDLQLEARTIAYPSSESGEFQVYSQSFPKACAMP